MKGKLTKRTKNISIKKHLGKKHLSKKHLGKKSRRRNVNSKKKTLRKNRKMRGGVEPGDECPICLEALIAEDRQNQRPLVRAHPSSTIQTAHVFHQRCLNPVLSGNALCPTCRVPIRGQTSPISVAEIDPQNTVQGSSGTGSSGAGTSGAGASRAGESDEEIARRLQGQFDAEQAGDAGATGTLAIPGDSASDQGLPMDWETSTSPTYLAPAHLVPVIGNEVTQYPLQLQAALSHPDQRGLFDMSVAGAVVEQHNALGGPRHLAGLTGVDANPHLAGGGYVRQAFIQRQLERGAQVQNPPAYARRMEIMRGSEDRRLGAIPEHIRHHLLHITETALQHYNADTPFVAIDITVNALTALDNAGLDLTNIQDEARFIQDYTNFVQTMINHLNLGIAHTPEQAAQTALTELYGS